MLCDIARLDGIINTKNDEEALVLAVRLLTKQVEFNMHCQELQDLLDMLAEGNEHAFEKAKEAVRFYNKNGEWPYDAFGCGEGLSFRV